MNKEKLNGFFDKNYKKLLLIPAVLLIFCFVFMFFFYSQNHDIIKKDISLTGGTSIQVTSNIDIATLQSALDTKFKETSVRQVSDILTGEQVAFIVETRANTTEIVPFLENYLGFKLTDKNSSIEFTGSTIGEGFYIQLMLAILFAFIFMGTVVFFIFSDNLKIKLLIVALSLITPILFFMFNAISINWAFILSFIVLAISAYFYIRYSIPGFLVVACAFADLFMTLVTVNLLGMEVSTAGVVAFIMLIGYSVDTDILLTTRVLKRRGESTNSKIFGSFKTGITMTLTALAIVIVGFIFTSSFSKVFHQLFTILIIGLIFDILNTWITNACLIKWYAEAKKLD
ncbi:MAG: hypothetical protein WC796_01180 [Candidatus Pacearchaeota archaeon]